MIWDYKSQLQEFCQAQKNKVDYYVQEIKKVENQPIFVIQVRDELGTFQEIGQGKSKKEAEQQAAGKVLKKLGLNELI